MVPLRRAGAVRRGGARLAAAGIVLAKARVRTPVLVAEFAAGGDARLPPRFDACMADNTDGPEPGWANRLP